MRCKKHPLDLSSVVGVCASCLREHLSAVVGAQAQAEPQQERNYYHRHRLDGTRLARAQSRDNAAEVSRKSDSHAHPPPLLFPRSVSPYVSYKKSDDIPSSSGSHHQRFYSTPQVGSTFIPSSSTASAAFSTSWKKKQGNRFSFLTNLLWSRSEKLNPCEPSSSSSPLRFSGIFSGRRNKQSPPTCSSELSGPIRPKPRRQAYPGMSPARSSLYNDDCDGSPSDSGRSPECSQAWRKTPPARWGKSVHSRNVSGWPFCLTPLAWASPSRQCSQKGVAAGHGLLRRGEGSGDAAAVDGDVVSRQPVEEARAFWESQS